MRPRGRPTAQPTRNRRACCASTRARTQVHCTRAMARVGHACCTPASRSCIVATARLLHSTPGTQHSRPKLLHPLTQQPTGPVLCKRMCNTHWGPHAPPGMPASLRATPTPLPTLRNALHKCAASSNSRRTPIATTAWQEGCIPTRVMEMHSMISNTSAALSRTHNCTRPQQGSNACLYAHTFPGSPILQPHPSQGPYQPT